MARAHNHQAIRTGGAVCEIQSTGGQMAKPAPAISADPPQSDHDHARRGPAKVARKQVLSAWR